MAKGSLDDDGGGGGGGDEDCTAVTDGEDACVAEMLMLSPIADDGGMALLEVGLTRSVILM